LIHHLRCSHAPDDVLAEATAHIRQALEALTPWLKQGEGWSTTSLASDTPGFAWRDDDLTAVMPYSPVSGKRNPIAPPVRMWKEGVEVHGEATFSPTYAGPPDSVHGGIIAAVFDELLSMANLNTPIELWGINVRQDGRKQLSRAEMRVNGEVTASAEGLFISAAESTVLTRKN
jgi:hypothetical protein